MADITRPIEPFELTQGFGNKLIINGVDIYAKYGLAGHNGWDLRTKFPDTPQGRRVILSSWLSKHYKTADEGAIGYGKYFEVIVKLENLWKLTYGHCQSIETFQEKKEMESMAISDTTGNSTGDHVHLTVKRGFMDGTAFKHYDQTNGFFGAVSPQIFFDELRRVKKSSIIEDVITDSTKIPQIDGMEVQKIKSLLADLNKNNEDLKRDNRELQTQINNLNGKITELAKALEAKPPEVVKEIIKEVPVIKEVIKKVPIATSLPNGASGGILVALVAFILGILDKLKKK